MTLPEVAEACGISLATVKRRIAETDELLRRRGHATAEKERADGA
jgi:DNA-directed RNA polymerase specialized sigma24 family protein